MFHVFILTVLFLQNHRVYLQAHHLNLFLVPFLSQQCLSRSMGSLRQPGSSQGLHMDAQGCRNALPHPSRCFHTGKGFRLIPLLSLQRKGPRNLDVPFPVIAQVPAEVLVGHLDLKTCSQFHWARCQNSHLDHAALKTLHRAAQFLFLDCLTRCKRFL